MQSGVHAPTPAELEAWNAQLSAIGEEYRALMQDLLARMVPSDAAESVHDDMRRSFQAGAESLMRNPPLLWQTQSRLLQDQAQLWQQSLRRLAGEEVEPLVTPAKGIAASRTTPGARIPTTWRSCSSTCCSRAWWRS